MLKRMLAANVLMAFFYGTILFVIVYASAWQGLSGNYQNRPRQYESFNIVTEVISAVQNFQKVQREFSRQSDG